MPGDNCSIYGCSVSRRSQYKGIPLFKVPSGEGEFETSWRQKLIAVITKDRVIDGPLKARINNKKLFICQRHFAEDQYHRHDNKCTLIPGALPTLNLPFKVSLLHLPQLSLASQQMSSRKRNLCMQVPCQ